MEDSEKRKERLKAMRMEASAQKLVSSHAQSYMGPGLLSNPLIETSNTTMMQDSSRTPRFDFYTDPMSAFSANKKSKASNHIAEAYVVPPTHSRSPETQFSPSVQGSINPELAPPAHQVHRSYNSPDQGYPAGISSPFPTHQGTTPRGSVNPEMMPPAHQGQESYYSPHQINQRGIHYSRFAPHGSPARMGIPFPIHQGTTPGCWNRPGNIPNYGFPSNDGVATPAPAFGAYGPGVDYGQSRGYWLGTSPNPASGHGGSPSSGRGRGNWHGSGVHPGSGRSGGRGRGFHLRGLHPDGTLRPERFYDKSMVEDPWKHLKPVMWKSVDTPGSSSSWLPKSISMKRERVPEAFNKNSSQPSLAEYLAASFNEAVDDAAAGGV